MRTLLTAALASAVCLSALAGCSQEPAPEPEPEVRVLSKQEFLDRANEICARGTRALDRRAADIDASTTAGARRLVHGVIVPTIRKQVGDIGALSGPPRLERRLEPVLEETERILDFIDEDPTRYTDSGLLFVSVNKDLISLGLTECGAS